MRAGLDTLLDGDDVRSRAPCGRGSGSTSTVAVPRGTLGGTRRTAPRLTDFFTRSGVSIVAGRAALVPVGASPAPAAERAAAAGAAAVLLYGGARGAAGRRPRAPGVGARAGRLDPDRRRAARPLARLAAGEPVTVSLGSARTVPVAEQGRVASFSSSGLAFDGRVKPDLVAPGVGLATSDPGANADGSPRFVTVNGSSAAAATVAGAAALLAQARPSLGADALKGLLVGTARQLEATRSPRRAPAASTSARRPPARSPRRRRRSRSAARPARAGASRRRSR